MTVRKAVIPAAGFGTRFLPVTKSQPKEMLPILDTPVIQYVVEEAVASGITDIIMVIAKGKRAIEEHFDRNRELENELAAAGKTDQLERIRRISDMADIHFVWQKDMNGLGDAVFRARHHVGNEPFAVLLGDTATDGPEPVTRQLMNVYDQYQGAVVALEAVPPEKVSRYGIAGGHRLDDGVVRIDKLIEKPALDAAPSNLAIASRYILTPHIFECLAQTPRGKNNEIQLTDAMNRSLASQSMYGVVFEGRRYDAGNKLDFIKINIEFAIKDDELGKPIKSFLKQILRRDAAPLAPAPTFKESGASS